MSLKIIFPGEIEELATALDGISEATARAAQDGPQSLEAFRLGVQVAMAAMVKATGGVGAHGRVPQQIAKRSAEASRSPCPLKGIYAEQSNGYYCRFHQQRCPLLVNPAYNYLTCPGWHNYEAERRQHTCYG